MRRVSINFLKFPFLPQVQVISCVRSPVYPFRYQLSCFSPHFSFLFSINFYSIHLFVISAFFSGHCPKSFLLIFMYSLNIRIDISTLSSIQASSHPLFLDSNSLSISSHRCKASCIVIIIIIYSLEFFTSALADGFSLESE